MLFNSAEFIFLFLPLTLLLFFLLTNLTDNRLAIFWLVCASLFFYGWWNPSYLLLIVCSMLVNYHIGARLRKSRSKNLLCFGIILNLVVLGYFKYAGFLVWNLSLLVGGSFSIEKIILPLAISFFTFQQISYLVDSWKAITEECHFLHYALFVTFFPQLIAGPIVHHKEILYQFSQQITYRSSLNNVAVGISIFAIGVFKKTIIADNMADYADPVFSSSEMGVEPDFFLAWSGALAYSFQLYFDFSGYSDMALGLARMFGVILPLNFYSPYKATSISEFWRRWHITLSRFLRDYIYIPLGGNRRGPIRRYIFLLVTMLLGGLWHGAGWNFLIWGGLHGSYLIINHGWRRLGNYFPKLTITNFLSWLITILAVIVGWVFFRASSLSGALNILEGMVGLNGFALPNAILARLGELGNWLQSMGVDSYHGGASQLVKAWISCFVMILFVVGLPNVQDIFREYHPSLSNFGIEERDSYWPGYKKAIRIIWRPNSLWATCSSLLLILAIMTLGQISDFLYFQF